MPSVKLNVTNFQASRLANVTCHYISPSIIATATATATGTAAAAESTSSASSATAAAASFEHEVGPHFVKHIRGNDLVLNQILGMQL